MFIWRMWLLLILVNIGAADVGIAHAEVNQDGVKQNKFAVIHSLHIITNHSGSTANIQSVGQCRSKQFNGTFGSRSYEEILISIA